MVTSSLLAVILLGRLIKLSLHWLESLLHHKGTLLRGIVILLGISSLVEVLRLLLIHHWIHTSWIILSHLKYLIWNEIIIWSSLIKEIRGSGSLLILIRKILVKEPLISRLELSWIPILTLKRIVCWVVLPFLFSFSL